jgi:hypothetical protein
MATYADLEIALRRRDEESYEVDLRFTQPDSDADTRLVEGAPTVTLDLTALRQHHLNHEAYGQALAGQLFGHDRVREAFNSARRTAQSQDVPLRVRLFIDPGAVELHSLRWETLRDPDDPESTLLTGEQVHFSRYLSSFDWQPVRPRARSELKGLVVIANPADVTDYQPGGRALAAVDVTGELARAKEGLGDMAVTALASGGEATLEKLVQGLREGYDVLYLACHGALIKGDPKLWLEDAQGATDVVSGRELVIRLKELALRPRLVVLASCQSAGSGEQARSNDDGALAALGPRLAQAGIPAVLAMQGNVTMETVDAFMPLFFSELQRDGQIDRAMAVARGAVREQPDWWMPVLFMRLKSGRLWYTPGFTGGRDGTEKWPALIDSIYEGECTPILGPGLTEPLFGTRRVVAHHLAEEYNFPLAAHAREDLPQVGQYITVTQQKPRLLPREFMGCLFWECSQRYAEVLPEGLRALAEKKRLPERRLVPALNELTQVVGAHRRERYPAEPYHVLARLPFPVYITTDPTNLLVDALRAVGKCPRLELCRWDSERFKDVPSIYDQEPRYWPDEDNPLVYHLFGHVNWSHTLVLTEDDYFDFLIGITSNTDLIPKIVRERLVDSALLFLGFQMDDWNFRVLFRSIMKREGRDRLEDYPNIAAQITPEEGRLLEPERASKYLETYFQRNAAISIYWGSSEDFIGELHQRWEWEDD